MPQELNKKTILAYTAGLLDGEGSIGLYKDPDKRIAGIYKYRLMVCIVSTNYAVLTLLKDKFIGAIYKHTGGLGTKQCWRWQIHGTYACEFLKKVYPYLIIKKDHAETAIKYQKTILNSRYEMTQEIKNEKDALVTQMKFFNGNRQYREGLN